MKLKLSAKFIFIILIVLIITILTFNYINRNSQLNSQKIQDIEAEWRDKSVTWATMDEEAVRAQFDSDEAYSDYKKITSLS